MKHLFFMMLTLTALFAVGQAKPGLTGTIPTPTKTVQKSPGTDQGLRFGSRITFATDTTITDTAKQSIMVFRPDFWAGYGYTTDGNSHAVAGVGPSIGKWTWTGSKWLPSWTVGIYGFANSNTYPKTFNQIVSFGVVGSYYVAGNIYVSGGYAHTLDGHSELLLGTKINLFPGNAAN